MLRRWHRLVAVGVALILGGGCRTVSDEASMHPLPPAPPGTAHYSDYQPINPFVPSQSGVLERSVFTATSPGFNVVVRDFIVSPQQPEAELPLDGAAALEVRQGYGKASVGKQELELRTGIVFTVNEGERLLITARDEPITFRTWIISAKEKP